MKGKFWTKQIEQDRDVIDITWLFWLILIGLVFIAGDVFHSYLTVESFLQVIK